MNTRYYGSNTNRWLSPDTIVPDPTNPQSFNRYSYVRNNPVNLTDPTGHRECGGPFDPSCNGEPAAPPEHPPRYYVSEDLAQTIFDDMADEADIPFRFPADGCYERAADMAERIADRYNIAETHIIKVFIYGDLLVETDYIYPGYNDSDVEWGYHVAPALLVITEDQGGIWAIIDPSIMDGPATLSEWKTTMNDPNAFFDAEGIDAYWPLERPRYEGGPAQYEDVSTGRLRGEVAVDNYLTLCVSAGYCQP